jgi:hypothetical protein
MVPPERLTEPDPATAVIVPAPQEPVRLLGVKTNRFGGNVSVKATLVMAPPEGLKIVKYNVAG